MDDLAEARMKDLVRRAVGGEGAALEEVLREIKDDIYNLALRMLGRPATAEEATQEILIQVVTHLGQWRAEATLQTWVWRISVRHLMRQKKTLEEEMCSFAGLDAAIAAGARNPALPPLSEVELAVLEKELRLNCTEAMMLSLDREHRVAWILGEVFELDARKAAEVLEVEAPTYRKRLSRARERLGRWMHEKCGLANAKNACSCRRQIPVAMALGLVEREKLLFAEHPVRSTSERRHLAVLGAETDAIVAAANVLCGHPDYAAPERLVTKLRELVNTKDLRILND